MSQHPFQRFHDQVAAAHDDAARRQVAAEVSQWRAAHLTDVPALRDAAWAMSQLLQALGDAAGALREAQALVSLCRTPPAASDGERKAAEARVAELSGGSRPAKKERAPRPEREPRAPKERAAPAPQADDLVGLADAGRFDDALAALRGKRGPRAQLHRAYVRLAQALAEPDAGARDAALTRLRDGLRRALGGEPAAERAEPKAPAPAPAPPPADDPVSKLLGAAVPRRRKQRIEAIEAWADENPEQLDVLASTALRHHVDTEGLKAPAPWLVGVVGRALASGRGAETRAAVDELKRAGAFAVSAYDEWPFGQAVRLIAAAQADGWDVTSMRRGVLAKVEPPNRRVWTLRVVRDFVERMIALVEPGDAAYPSDAVGPVLDRLASLCPRVVLVAPGASLAGLRDAAAAGPVVAIEEPADALAAAAALEGAPEPAPAPAAPPAPKPERAKGGGDSPLTLLRDAMDRGDGADALAEILAPLRQRFRAFRSARAVMDQLEPAEADVRVAALLEALHRTAGDEERLPEGVTVAVRMAALAPGGATAAMLEADVDGRLGGPGAADVASIVGAAEAEGWRAAQVLVGPTGKELRDDPALAALGRDTGGLWRVRASRGDDRAELWYCRDLTPEGRAMAARLALVPATRSVVAVGDELVEWLRTLPGVNPIAWSELAPSRAVSALAAGEA